MTICFYGSAKSEIDEKYISACRELGYKCGMNGMDLVYGCGKNGLMGAFSEGILKAGAKVTGVVPEYLNTDENARDSRIEKIVTKDLGTRKSIMQEKADAFIVAPGGYGTFDELFQILTLKQLSQLNKEIIIYNIDNFYDWLLPLINKVYEKKFTKVKVESLIMVSDDADEIVKRLNTLK